jgi:hypothetical protein
MGETAELGVSLHHAARQCGHTSHLSELLDEVGKARHGRCASLEFCHRVELLAACAAVSGAPPAEDRPLLGLRATYPTRASLRNRCRVSAASLPFQPWLFAFVPALRALARRVGLMFVSALDDRRITGRSPTAAHVVAASVASASAGPRPWARLAAVAVTVDNSTTSDGADGMAGGMALFGFARSPVAATGIWLPLSRRGRRSSVGFGL